MGLPPAGSDGGGIYRAVFEAMDAPAVVVDAGLTIFLANKAFERFSGFRTDEIEGRKVLADFLGSVPTFPSAESQIEKERDPKEGGICRFVDKAGNSSTVSLTISPLQGWKGSLVSFQVRPGISMAAQSTAESSFRALADEVPCGIMVVDSTGRTLYLNEEFTRITGYRVRDLPSRDEWFLKAHPDPAYRKKVMALLTQGRSGTPGKGRIAITCWGGERKEVAFRVAHLERGIEALVFSDVTPERRVEEGLKETKEHYRVVFEGSRDAIFIASEDSRLVAVNEAACVLTGYPRDELLTMSMPDLYEESGVHAYRKYFARIMAGESVLTEVGILRRDGSKVDAELSNRMARIGNVKYLHTIARDVSERKRAEEALRESEARYRVVIESCNDGVAIVRGDEHIYVNDKFVTMFGYGSREEVLSQPKFAWIHSGDRKKVLRVNAKRQRGESVPERYEVRGVRRDGSLVDIEVSAARILLQGQYQTLAFLRDVTERKHAEEALQESERKYRAIFENAVEGIFQTTPDGRYLTVNPTLARMYGYETPEEMIENIGNIDQQQYVNPEDRKQLKALYAQQGFVKAYEAQVYTKQRRPIWISMNGRVVHGSQGKILYYEGTTENITERKLAEEALRTSEERFSKAFRNNPSLMSITTMADGRFIEVNDTFLRVTGYQREEVIGKTSRGLGLFVDSQDRDFVVRALEEKGRVQDMEVRIRLKDGDIATVSFSGEVVELGQEECWVAVAADVTERKRAEEELLLSNRKLQDIIEFLPDATVVIDNEGKVIAWNRAIEEMTGVGKGDVLGRGNAVYSMAFYGKARPMLIDLIGKSYKELESRYRDVRIGDDIIYAEAFVPCLHGWKGGYSSGKASKLRDPKGNVIGAIESIRDVTERARAEEALRESENKFRDLVEKSTVGVYLLQDGIFRYVNPAFAQIHGYAAEELIDLKGPRDLVPSGDWASVRDGVKRCESELAGTIRLDLRTLTKTGRVIEANLYGATTVLNGRQAIIGTLIDVTERKGIEDKLRESEDRFRRIFEQRRDAVFLFKAGTCEILDVNPAAVDLYGYGKDMLLKEGPSLFLHGSERVRFEETLRAAGQGQGIYLDNMATVKKDGSRVSVAAQGNLVTMRDYQVVHCSFQDISERIRIEEERALLHAKLIQANKMSSLGVLVSSVAHEINNPNNFILFNSALLGDAWRDAVTVLNEHEPERGDFSLGGLPFSEMREAVPRLLDGIAEGARRIKRIVENLKDFARQDTAGVKERVDVNRVVTAATTMLGNQIKRYTKTFQVELEPNLPAAGGNFQQLEQVVINLIMNGLQALPDKHKGISIRTFFEVSEKSVVIAVKDEGAGMPREIQERIFEPFFTTKLDSGGTGLGLAISHSIVKEHSGTLQFRSVPGEGTTALVSLPALDHTSPRGAL
jgi:PAS domain S-box-containing protein